MPLPNCSNYRKYLKWATLGYLGIRQKVTFHRHPKLQSLRFTHSKPAMSDAEGNTLNTRLFLNVHNLIEEIRVLEMHAVPNKGKGKKKAHTEREKWPITPIQENVHQKAKSIWQRDQGRRKKTMQNISPGQVISCLVNTTSSL